jgi:hypothetical protein
LAPTCGSPFTFSNEIIYITSALNRKPGKIDASLPQGLSPASLWTPVLTVNIINLSATKVGAWIVSFPQQLRHFHSFNVHTRFSSLVTVTVLSHVDSAEKVVNQRLTASLRTLRIRVCP